MSFTIKELEALSGIKSHTIRIWEQRYAFLVPSRTPTNIRRYGNEELKTLLNVALLNKYGYKISRINDMQPAQRMEAIQGLQQPDAKEEHVVNKLIGHMIDLESHAFEQLLARQIEELGIEKTISGTVFAFLERIGILWQTNRLRPVEEHIVSAIIRQKVIYAIDRLPLPEAARPLTVLALPEDEHHELGLLYVYYLLRRRGLPSIYLGADVPLNDLQYIIEVKFPDYLYMHLTALPTPSKLQRLIQQLASAGGSTQLVISGMAAQAAKAPSFSQVRWLDSLAGVQAYVEAL